MEKYASWEERFNDLKDYRKLHGNCNVPQTYQPNKALGNWVNTQRKQYKKFQNGEKSFITKERILKLDSIEFVWNIGRGRGGLTNDELWEKRFEESTRISSTANKRKETSRKIDMTNPKRQKQDSLLPESALSSTYPTVIDATTRRDEEETARIHLRDEILAIALTKADRQVWGISNESYYKDN